MARGENSNIFGFGLKAAYAGIGVGKPLMASDTRFLAAFSLS